MKRRRQVQSAAAQTMGQVRVPKPLTVVARSKRKEARTRALSGVLIGELVAILDGGRTPLVIYDGQTGSAAIPARAIVDLRAEHIGSQVALMFESGDGARPVIMGRVRDLPGSTLTATPNHVEVEADGDRLTVTAKEQVVIQCGEASITLTRAGKVLIRGKYVASRSSGANRIKGGSVQLN